MNLLWGGDWGGGGVFFWWSWRLILIEDLCNLGIFSGVRWVLDATKCVSHVCGTWGELKWGSWTGTRWGCGLKKFDHNGSGGWWCFLTTKGTEITKFSYEIAFPCAHPHRHSAKKWVRRAAGTYLPFFCLDSSSSFRVRSRDSRFNFFLTQVERDF